MELSARLLDPGEGAEERSVTDPQGSDQEVEGLDKGAGGDVQGGGDELDARARMSWQEAVFMIIAIIIGVAVLAIPQALRYLGWILGIFVIFIFAAVGVYSGITITQVFVLCNMVEGRRPETLGDMAEMATGSKRWRTLCQFTQYTNLWCFLVMVQYLTSNTLKSVVVSADSYICRWAANLVVMLLMVVPLQLRTLADITRLCVLGVFMIFLAIVLYFSELGKTGAHTNESPPILGGFYGYLNAAMTIAFAFQGQVVFPEILREMQAPSTFSQSSILAGIVLIVTYTFVGALGYEVMGIESKLLDMWDNERRENSKITLFANLFLVVHLMVGYTINGNVLQQAMAQWWLGCADASTRATNRLWLQLTSALLLSYYIASNVVPNLSLWISFIGATSGFLLMIIFPSMFALYAKEKYAKYHESTECSPMPWLEEDRLHRVVFALAVMVMILGTISSVHGLVNPKHPGSPPFSC